MQNFQRKICLVGSFAVGKTSLVRRCVEGKFDDKYLSTIGVKVSRRAVSLENATVKLLIWDLAGGDDVLRSNTSYLRGLAGAMIVCDLTRDETLDIAVQYAEKVRAVNQKAVIVLVGNKVDLLSERQITSAELTQAGDAMGAACVYETSAKTGAYVIEAFEQIAMEVVA